MEVKKYWAFRSDNEIKKRKYDNELKWWAWVDQKWPEGRKSVTIASYYNDVSQNKEILCTAVYPCDEYESPEEILEKVYLLKDAEFVGIVDKFIRYEYL